MSKANTENNNSSVLSEKRQQRVSLVSSSEQHVRYGSSDLDKLNSSLKRNQNKNEKENKNKKKEIQDSFNGTRDGRVNPHRRPEIVDRLHILFLILIIPASAVIFALSITLYVKSSLDAQMTLYVISGVASFAAVGMTGLLILCHLTTYTCPIQQRLIFRILLLVPVYALDSFIALIFYRVATIVVLIRDTYESYVIYQFYLLLMEYLGGEERVLSLWNKHGTGDGYIDLDHDDEYVNNNNYNNNIIISHNNTTEVVTIVEYVESVNESQENQIKEDIKNENGIDYNSNSYHKIKEVASTSSVLETPTVTKIENKNKNSSKKYLEAPLLSEQEQNENENEEYIERSPTVRKKYIPHLFPINICFSPIQLNSNTLYLWKLFITQYVILNPFLTLLTIPLYFTGKYHDGSFNIKDSYPYLALIRTISVTFALTALIYFYFATKVYMKVYSPTSKFLAIKAVVFLSFWQGLLLSALVYYNFIPDMLILSAKEVATALQNFLICLEMYIISIIHRWVFADDIYLITSEGKRNKLQIWIIRHVLSISDVIENAGSVVRLAPQTAERMIRQQIKEWKNKKKIRRNTLRKKQHEKMEGNIEVLPNDNNIHNNNNNNNNNNNSPVIIENRATDIIIDNEVCISEGVLPTQDERERASLL